MDHIDNLQERIRVFEHETETLPPQAGVIARPRCQWRSIAGCLVVLSLLSLALPVRTVEAQANVFIRQYLPISLCSSSDATFRLSGLTPPAVPGLTLLCPVVETFPDFLLKSNVTLMRVFYVNKVTTGHFIVSVCSQQSDDPQAERCNPKTGPAAAGVQNISFTRAEMRGTPNRPWAPSTESGVDTAFGYIKLEFSGTAENPDQIVSGIFFF
jgi:hypothetical protein